MNTIKRQFIKYKYLQFSIAILIATLLMVGFNATSIGDFFLKIGRVLSYAAAIGFGIYIVTIFSMWVLFPFIPKYEDFGSAEERDRHGSTFSLDLLFFVYTIIAITLMVGGLLD